MWFAWRSWPVELPPGPRVLSVPDAYPLIAAALTDARAGDTIEVSAGTYHEQVELKEGVRLVAAGEVVLEPKADASQPGAAIVIRNVRSGVVSGFRIVVPAGSGVSAGVLVTDSDVELTGLDIQGAGILIRGSSRPTIRGSRIHHNAGAAVAIEGDAAPRLVSNIITDNAVGLAVSGYAQPVVTGNVFGNNARNFSREDPELLKQNLVIGRRASAGAGLGPRSGKK
jgi:nitrous oxidase accessory protein NosD